MALTWRQVRLYTDTISIYRNVRGSSSLSDFAIPSTPIYTNVKCHFDSTPEYDEPSHAVGRYKRPNQMNADLFHMEAGVDIKDGDVIKCTTSGKPYSGNFWAVQGNPQVKSFRANKQEVFAVRIDHPGSIA